MFFCCNWLKTSYCQVAQNEFLTLLEIHSVQGYFIDYMIAMNSF